MIAIKNGSKILYYCHLMIKFLTIYVKDKKINHKICKLLELYFIWTRNKQQTNRKRLFYWNRFGNIRLIRIDQSKSILQSTLRSICENVDQFNIKGSPNKAFFGMVWFVGLCWVIRRRTFSFKYFHLRPLWKMLSTEMVKIVFFLQYSSYYKWVRFWNYGL